MSTVIQVKGCLRDQDYRPLKPAPAVKDFERLKSQLKASTQTAHVIPQHTPISDQGSAGTCVANAFCDGVELLLGLEHGVNRVVQLSRRHLYWVARVTHGATNLDFGTYLHAAAWQLQEVGVCAEQYFPYSDQEQDLVVSPPLSTYSMASANRVTGHFRITSRGRERGDDIERSVRADHPVAFGTAVSSSFMKYRGDGVYDVRPKERSEGNHAMLIVGVRNEPQRQFLLRNSWGKSWGNKGLAWVTEQFITRSASEDFWVLTRMQNID